MHFNTLTTLPFLIVPLTTAAILPFPSFTCSKSGNPGAVYYCRTRNFNNAVAGDCIYHLPDPKNACFTTPFAVQSIGPDKGGYCVLFEDKECLGSVITLEDINRVVCPGVKKWPSNLPKAGSMACYAGSS
ncbi:hypothetical protein C7974DRAFT_59856 [Boeremia exigua]|uniref:uncharacterized protein n=1 Tax=Boeremia exigua TaxID=749465 RepID=UPI001E8E411B|nr:uncharacterized protein C7974DRAFT_59856 [Boeremia exigua]KAH6615135.1 hypothetical protein C7974DRAFT_59856 [Boeremia exigua]